MMTFTSRSCPVTEFSPDAAGCSSYDRDVADGLNDRSFHFPYALFTAIAAQVFPVGLFRGRGVFRQKSVTFLRPP